MIVFLKQCMAIKEKMEIQDLEIYTNSYITSQYKAKEADCIYQWKKKNAFFLIEHQTKIDNHMAERILEYSIEIARSVKDRQQGYPTVMAIVVYTGHAKWKAKQAIQEMMQKIDGGEKYALHYQYFLLDSNAYTKEELFQSNMLLFQVMALEKCKTKEEMIELLEKIIEKVKTNQKELIYRMIHYILTEIIGMDEAKKIEKN